MSQELISLFYHAIDHPELVFAVTGTTSSGKSTLVDDTITRWQQLKERHCAPNEQLEGLTLAHLRSTDASAAPLPWPQPISPTSKSRQ